MSLNIRFKNENLGAEGIRVHRSESPMSVDALPEPVDVLAGNATEYVDNNTTQGTTYRYRFAIYRGADVIVSAEHTAVARVYTGPGTAAPTVGDRTIGWHGTVSASTFITGSALAEAVALTAGTAQNDTSVWMKYSYLGKTLFIPQKPLRHSISWADLAAADLVTGNRTVRIAGHDYRVRLIRGANTDPALDEPSYDGMNTHGSEWNELIYPTHATIPEAQPDVNWASYTDANLVVTSASGDGSYTWCQEDGTTPGSHVVRGYFGLTYIATADEAMATAAYGWRPVLELVA